MESLRECNNILIGLLQIYRQSLLRVFGSYALPNICQRLKGSLPLY